MVVIGVVYQLYHVLNRANARLRIFDQEVEYREYLKTLNEGLHKFEVDLFVYEIMPNHWHLVLSPRKDGELSRLMHWVTMTHTQRWHSRRRTRGTGHFYQGRFKSFLIKNDHHLLQVFRYVERNALRAGLVGRAEEWRWSSLYQRENGLNDVRLSNWPIDIPEDYIDYVNEPQKEEELLDLRESVNKQKPYGDGVWLMGCVEKHNLQSTIRGGGRPKKENRS